jgi:hypothetical protein
MKLKPDIDYDTYTLSKIYNETADYELGKTAFDVIIERYFAGSYYRPKLNLLIVIDEEDIKKTNLDVGEPN